MAYITPEQRKRVAPSPEPIDEGTNEFNVILTDALLTFLSEKGIIDMEEFTDFLENYKPVETEE